MRTRERLRRGVLAGLLLVWLAGCGAGKKPGANAPYPEAYRSVMTEYRDEMTRLAARPLPAPSPSQPRAERRALAARQVHELAAATQGFVRKLDGLTPPAQWTEVHAATRDYLQVSANGNQRWAAAIQGGNREVARGVLAAAKQEELAAVRRWKKAADALGEKVPAMERLLAEMEQEAREGG
jgi:hypothetical protein